MRFQGLLRSITFYVEIIFCGKKVVFPVFWPFSGKTVITVIKIAQNIIKTLPYIIPITNLAKYEPNRITLKNQLDIPSDDGEGRVKLVLGRTFWVIFLGKNLRGMDA